MRRCRGAGLAGLAAVLLVAVGRGQVQQEPSAETIEGTEISINCSHPNIKTGDYIYWYRQLLGRGPELLVWGIKGSKALSDPPGRLSVAADRRSSTLWLNRPRRGDAAVYYCAVRDTGRGAGAATGHELRRAGPGGCMGERVNRPGRARQGALWLCPLWPLHPTRFPRPTGIGTSLSINTRTGISGTSLLSLPGLTTSFYRRLLRVYAPEGSKEPRLGSTTCGD